MAATMLSSTLLTAPSCNLKEVHSRRMLVLLDPRDNSVAPAAAGSALAVFGGTSELHSNPRNSFNTNVTLVLAVVLFAIICGLVANIVVRCVIHTIRWAWLKLKFESEPEPEPFCLERAAAGVTTKAAVAAMPSLSYPIDPGCLRGGTECAICLSEFAPGENKDIRVLPKCNHGFHVQCIDQWLMSRSSCPTCRRCIFDTHGEISAGEHADRIELVRSSQAAISTNPEGLAFEN